MLATNPVDPDMAFRFGTLTSVGAHSHVSPRDEKGLGAALNIVGAAALLVIGYIVGGAATAAGSASVDTPQPVERGMPLRTKRADRRRVPARPGQ